ncbi:tripartite tricarboxylate transporter substrate binding protein [Acidovorax sp. Be4]|uniref:Tripartite tricarboxylate transporter substrate binding protein n=1 Tax=Acidovorax bellezanensis TaxID=2976702 RepID=A0ABT2PKH4_9BURK|nr:tripartite tricarboxylate transporter substrate binding protein [Acidovorax sp. Be4]MCT9810969.1 tripartite tricarboxylate transporter substrate binding protein [Acidovorax sp. Be4]
MHKLSVFAGIALASCLGFSPLATVAAEPGFPSRAITLVVPFPPGGVTNGTARIIGQRLSEELGQSVVVDNRGGAASIIGATYVARAAPDGYTLLLTSGTTFTVNPAIRANLPYDPLKSFEPIGVTGRTGLILLANNNAPVQTVRQFVDYVKASPGKYAYASFGAGTTSQFAGESILHAAGLKMTHVPYKGSAQTMTDLMGGQIVFSVDTVSAAIPLLKSGKIKAIALTAAKRSSFLPDVPTLAESGYPDIDMDTWLMLVAPKGLPADTKARLEKALAVTMADPDTRTKLSALGLEPSYSNAAAASELIKRELPIMRAIAARANIIAD